MFTGAFMLIGLVFTFMLCWAIPAYVLYSIMRRKALLSNIVGAVVAIIVCSFYISAIPDTPQEIERKRVAAFLEEKKQEMGPEKWAEFEKSAKSGALNDRSTQAAIICANFIQDRLKSPSSADFPFDRAGGGIAADTTSQTYSVRSYVDADNGFGAKTRQNYICKVRYLSGLESDKESWELQALTF